MDVGRIALRGIDLFIQQFKVAEGTLMIPRSSFACYGPRTAIKKEVARQIHQPEYSVQHLPSEPSISSTVLEFDTAWNNGLSGQPLTMAYWF